MVELDRKDTDRYFEELNVGETYTVERARTITKADIVNFAGVTGDYHPIHMSDGFAKQDSAFSERVAHGNLIHSMTESIITDQNPKEFSYGHDNLRFVKPVYPGDTLSVSREIRELDVRDERYGKAVYRYETRNQNSETVLVNDHIKLVERTP